ncbi:MAG: type II toxin-antitoxin system prevent-host-death family antitoxin [Puniceicoccales bacterium]|jgi:prevent-host-death family protein|nr:type II toxin-antitoxin system prevent-host-death family antitoxin [Puniceicoccales bacterium]
MNTINIQAAKTHLSRLVEQVVAGEEVILAKAGKPLVRLVPFKPVKAPRKGGQWQGQVWETSDCWEPETDDLLDTSTGLLPSDESFLPSGHLHVAENTRRAKI